MVWKPDNRARFELESKAHLEAINGTIADDETLCRRMLESYEEVCGLLGKDVFEQNTLPRALKLMRGKYRTMTRELLRIIEHGSLLTGQEIGPFLADVIPDVDSNYQEQCEKYREKKLQALSEAIKNSFGKIGRCGIPCNIIAAVVYGSMAKEDNHIFSDVDFNAFMNAKEPRSLVVFQKELRRLDVPHHQIDEVYRLQKPDDIGIVKDSPALIVMSPVAKARKILIGHIQKKNPDCRVREYVESDM